MTGFATAAALAARGFAVFPIATGAKSPPLWRDWPNRATTEPEGLIFREGWSGQENTGIHCAGLVVIDVDPKNGGFESLLDIDLKGTWDGNALPPTLTSLTPSGGCHLFYRLPEGHPGVGNSAGKLDAGIDVRSAGGYVVGAGSRIANGEYTWQNPDTSVAPAPEWLLLKLGTTVPKLDATGQDVSDASVDVLGRAAAWLAGREGAVEGQGGDAYTFATAAFLRDYGLSARQTMGLLETGWNPRCSPPWRPDDLWAKVENAYAYATGEPGAKAVTPDDFPTVEQPIAPKPASGAAKRSSTLRLGAFAVSQTDGPGYLVKGLLTRNSYAELYGPPGAGKTFVALDIAYHVAAGTDWMGNRVHQGLVLYLAYEGTGGLVKRAQALRQHYGDKDVPFYVTSADFNLREPAGRQALRDELAKLPAKPSLVVIDTFARALMGGDENSAQDVGAFNSAVGALIEATGACVLILHHTGKDRTRGPRGSSALQGAIDTEIEIDGRVLVPTKQRDIESGQPIGYRLVPLVVGMDDDADPITSCIVTAQEATATPPSVRLKGNAKLGWDLLCTLRPTNAPIKTAEWQEACKEFLGEKGLRQRFYDVRTRLVSARLIEVDGNGMITRRMG